MKHAKTTYYVGLVTYKRGKILQKQLSSSRSRFRTSWTFDASLFYTPGVAPYVTPFHSLTTRPGTLGWFKGALGRVLRTRY